MTFSKKCYIISSANEIHLPVAARKSSGALSVEICIRASQNIYGTIGWFVIYQTCIGFWLKENYDKWATFENKVAFLYKMLDFFGKIAYNNISKQIVDIFIGIYSLFVTITRVIGHLLWFNSLFGGFRCIRKYSIHLVLICIWVARAYALSRLWLHNIQTCRRLLAERKLW